MPTYRHTITFLFPKIKKSLSLATITAMLRSLFPARKSTIHYILKRTISRDPEKYFSIYTRRRPDDGYSIGNPTVGGKRPRQDTSSSLLSSSSRLASFSSASNSNDNNNNNNNNNTTVDSKWKDLTSRLLQEQPVGSFSALTWHEAQETLKYWIGLEHNVERCWTLLDRFVLEQKQKRNEESSTNIQTPIFSIDVSNGIVNLWRKQFKQPATTNGEDDNSSTNLLLPSQVATQLLDYQEYELLRFDAFTYSMILDAASHYTKDPKEGVLFADHYLKEWIQHYQDGVTYIAPDVVAVGSVIHAWAESGLPQAPQRAEEWMTRSLPDLGLEPNTLLYTSVISAWFKAGNPHKAQECLHNMLQQHNLVPDTATWNTLLLGWSQNQKDPQAAERAESILNKMRLLYDSGAVEESPDVFSYSIVLDAWAKKAWTDPKAAQRAQSLLEQMKDSGDVQPNTVSYNTVITAHSRAGNPQQAEALLQEMMEDNARGNGNIQPDVQSFSSVLSGWSRVGTVQAAERAESLLRNVMPKVGIVPNVQTYGSCINCWAKASTPNDHHPVQRAQALYQEMNEEHAIAPDVMTYAALMNAWGRHGQASKAQGILEDLLREYQHNSSLKPNVHCFTTVLKAWSHSKDPQAPEQAEALLKRMADYHVQPNVVSYSTVLDAWAKSSHSQAPDRAQAILNHMRSSPHLHPNIISYTTVMKAYAKQGRAEEAEALLQEMFQDTNLPNPDLYSFSTVLYAWSKCQLPNAAQHAERLLVRMQELYAENLIAHPPNVVCYSNVLACWAHSGVHGAAQRALDILRRMQQLQPGVSPNRVSYNTVMNAWANEARRNDEAVHQVQALLEELEKLSQTDPQLKPDRWTYGAVWKALAASHLPDKVTRGNEVLRQMNQQGLEPTQTMMKQMNRWQKTGDHKR
jgi:pentatricopeptide repeat protein